ncbi:hypothetical protein DOTSEDRAFT_46837 [Dothistroma septosporum NZE10]|uniref:Poly A polymerase head domain-containing protein n=1 Tax=Dothistroma septosporum (strain NZE10 / CBS 128990) TaxID=675120 RepID=N1PDL4_DOTSN|nr:hypothetical protein DOTSEDRAFT_46837 [Dothistroma septosporum NZE10]
MSPVRLVTTSPEGYKRRRLDSPTPPRRRAFSNMAPVLVQEVEDDTPQPTIDMTPVETTFRRLLLDTAEYIQGNPISSNVESQVPLPLALEKEPLVLRFTGGWVRDKLLGVQSHDIDVAINKMTGFQFALRMKEYLELPGNLEKYGLESIAANEKQSAKAGTTDKSKTVGGLHKIEANPEKSKHLETTTVKILGMDIDFVNLRKETYSDDSRNPQMEFGTPEEDALRRDATVNAMFYNINTEEIEDFTGQGHDDMRDNIIRTPLEPYQTFKDDPLRVLRLIRFASRLGYTIDQDALEAMRNGDIKDALRRKISRERVGVEMEKSLQGPDPHEALRLVFELDLYDTIFSDPAVTNDDHYSPDTEGWKVLIDTVEDLTSGGIIHDNLIRDQDERYLAWTLAALVPYRDAPEPMSPEPNRKAPPAISVNVAREGIKAPNKICDVVGASVRNQNEVSSLVDRLHEKKRRPDKKIEGEDPAARDVLGIAIRRWGASWRSQVVYALLVDVANSRDRVEAIERKYASFIDHIRSLEILDVCTLRPLLDGKQLAKAIGTPPGPWMKDALDVVMAWQLRNPGITDPAQAIEEVKNHQANGELTIGLLRHFLKLTIRPLFIKASPSNVTEQGRKVATPALPKKMTMKSMDDATERAWKASKDAYILDILLWVVRSLNKTTVEEMWPLVVPPILTLLDDWETQYKIIGVRLLHQLLFTTPPSLLARTGLGEVFEEALMPCLTYLPDITPEPEAIEILAATYPCLLTLAGDRFPPDATQPLGTNHRNRVKFLDSVIRRGIIYAYTHCSNHPKIVALLFEHLTTYLDVLGIDCVKHIKYILPMMTETLSHRLAVSDLNMLESAVGPLQALIRNAWPRMVVHRGEVLKGLCLCWLNLADQEHNRDGAQALRTKLQRTVEILTAAVEKECDIKSDFAALVRADGRLGDLFLEVER